ncbi:MAG TPA: twin-arginine translocation signal domain-containing protein [Clostridia bacterium]|nr:twin-arginine translocation signal domain-containing protein [Clostridia bacterium]
MTTQKDKQITRKDFLKGVGVSVAGVAMAGTMGSILTACADKENSQTTDTSGSNPVKRPEWPFKYEKLDPEKVKERAFNAYQTKGG